MSYIYWTCSSRKHALQRKISRRFAYVFTMNQSRSFLASRPHFHAILENLPSLHGQTLKMVRRFLPSSFPLISCLGCGLHIDMFDPIYTKTADLSQEYFRSMQHKRGRYYHVDWEVIMLLGLKELRCQYCLVKDVGILLNATIRTDEILSCS